MKTTNLFRLTFLVIAILGLSFAGCKKDKTTEIYPSSVSLQQLTGDQESMESAMDESMNDVNNYLSGGDMKSSHLIPCNATIDSTPVAHDTITFYITYNGLNCNGTRFRTGKVEIKKLVGMHWYQQGAIVIIRHIDFTITKVSNQNSITLNGVKMYKNLTGGIIWQVGNGIDQLVHSITGQVTVTFSEGTAQTSKTWNIARMRTFTGSAPNNLTMTVNGFGTADGFQNLLVWGTSRAGETFYTEIIQPVVHRQLCEWNPCAGIKKHSVPAESKSATITFGYDSGNNPVTGDACPAKYRVDWQKANNSGTIYLWL
ncbi:MAG: hypothetical protein NTW16_02195 [Bacteroidetes bacterium]|nr:hypothetical protein [Bacteroidota bacterium]